ncbi:MAG: DNA-processing protein DprA [Lachnospiraceae bacterium]|nr:DNA-processing protein DprA [Lachnospiraceae bacterium]
MEKALLNLWFNNIEDIGNITRLRLLKNFGNVENIYEANKNVLSKHLTDIQVNNLLQSKEISKSKEEYERLKERNINIIYWGHRKYPSKLYNIYDSPTLLYVKGTMNDSINSYNSNIAIVGSRKLSVYGREITDYFSKRLATSEINIVSGMARGIDSIAHMSALKAGGYTIAVLGSGINVPYPQENTELYAMIEKKGVIISEYGLDVKPNPGYFPMRNRIISGLSDGVLVVEAEKKSGSLITADYALEQGKQVYAVPGRLLDKNSEGTNNLIKAGAYLVTHPNDILSDIKGKKEYSQMSFNLEQPEITIQEEKDMVNKNFLAPIEKIVYSCLSLEPKYIDDIIQHTGMGVTKTISTLFTMEEKGLIKQPLKGYYIISI